MLRFNHTLCLVPRTACFALHGANIGRLEDDNAALEEFNVQE